ncbi:MAG: sensor histidine kinase [Actinomycetota bacterium]
MRFFQLSLLSAVPEQSTLKSPKQKRNLVLLSFLAGSTLLVGAVALLSYQVVRQLILQHIEDKAWLQVEKSLDQIDDWLATRKAEIDILANTPTVHSMDWSAAQPYLISEQKRLKNFLSFLIAFPDGTFYSSGLRGRATVNIKDRDYFKQAMIGETFISDPVTARPSKEPIPIVPISTPIRQNLNSGVAPKGVFTGLIQVQQVLQVVSQLNYGKGSYAFALNSQGEPIFHPNPKLRGTLEKPVPSFLQSTDPNLADLARRMVNQEQGIELREFDGTWKYVAFAHLKEVNWSIALIIPRHNIESPLNALNFLASILGFLLGVAIVGGWRQVQLFEKTQEQVKLLGEQAEELHQALAELKRTQMHLVQSEKMSSLGQMVAGIAHEINNPVNFIYGNLSYTSEYAENLLQLVELYKKALPQQDPEVCQFEEEIELTFIQKDLPQLLASMKIGAERIRQIVLSLRNFSRLDEADRKQANLHEGIDNTILLLHHKIKDKIQLNKCYGNLPLVECYPSQMNQVFMNLISNAIEALIEVPQVKKQITIATEYSAEDGDGWVKIAIADNGPGIPSEIQSKIFDPFFTTKPIGQGTGLGLAISYQIVVDVHKGKISVQDSPMGGAEFVVEFPAKAA